MSSLSSNVSQQKIPKKILCLVISYSFLRSFNPFLSYTVPYMVQVKGLSNFQVTNKVFPMYSYGLLACLLLLAPVCEHLSYRTVIIVGTFSALFDKLLLRLGVTVLSLQVMEIVTAFSGATLFVYQAYLFFLVTENHFQTMTGFSQASTSAALFVASEIGQILVLIGSSYNNLLYIAIASAAINCILVFLLPKEETRQDKRQHFMLNFFSRDQGFWSIIKETWSDKRLQVLSLWWAFALAGFELSLNYGTVLFESIDSASTYNGQVVAIGTALAVVMALCSVYLRKPMAKLGGLIYIFGSIAYGAFCLKLAYTRVLWVAYVIYIILLGIEKLMICFVYAQCGSLVKNDRYALMFSFNSGLGQATMVVVQAIIEAANMDIVSQYKVLAIFFFVVAVLFSVPYGVYVWKTRRMEIISPDDLGAPKLSKIDPFHEPLMENESSVCNGN